MNAVLFDLDGTLLDTLDDLADSMNATLEELGASTHPPAAYKQFVGEGVEMLARRALPAAMVNDATVSECVARMQEHYGQRWDRKTRLYPGIADLLDGLVQRRWTLAILSNKPHEFTCRIADKLLSPWPFDPILGARDGVPRKPDPTVARQIAAQHNIDPGDWLYLGDTAIDMQTATRAGMVPVGVLWGFRPEQELRQAGARHLLADPRQLLDLQWP